MGREQQYRQAWSPHPRCRSQRQAIKRTWHGNVGRQQRQDLSGGDHVKRLGSIGCLDHSIAGVAQPIGIGEADENFILDQQNRRWFAARRKNRIRRARPAEVHYRPCSGDPRPGAVFLANA